MAQSAVEIIELRAGELSDADVDACVRIIAKGNAVDPASARRNLPRSCAVAVARIGGEIVGVGTVKPIRRAYAERTAEESGFPFDPATPELGYVAVDPDHRGKHLSTKIVKILAMGRSALYARTSDPRMKSALIRGGFAQRGAEWLGRRGDRLSFWLKE